MQTIVSWITENNYPKSNEYIYFFLSLSIPAICFYFFGALDKNESPEIQKDIKTKNVVLNIVIPILLYFALLNLNINGQIDLYHEGERLQLQGLPYQDFYIQHGLILNYLLPKLSTLFFSEDLASIRTVFAAFEPLAYIIIYYLGLNFFRGRVYLALLPSLFCSGIAYWIGLREALAVSVLLAICNNQILLSGVLSAITFWFSVDYGLYAIIGSLSFFALEIIFTKQNYIKRYSQGLALICLPILLLFTSLGILDDFLKNLYLQIAYQNIVWGKAFWKPSFDIWSVEFRVFASIFIIIISLCYLAYKLGKNELFCSDYHRKLLLINLFSILFFRTALGRADYGHWIDGTTLLIFLLFAPFDYLIFSKNNLKIKALSLISFFCLLLYLNQIHKPLTDLNNRIKNYFPQKVKTTKLHTIGKMEVPQSQLEIILAVKEFIQSKTEPRDFIYDFANQSAYYFLLERKSPTKYFNTIYAATREMQEEIIRDLKNKKPKVVIFSTGTIYDAIDGIPASKRYKPVYDYVIANYSPAKVIGATSLYTLNN